MKIKYTICGLLLFVLALCGAVPARATTKLFLKQMPNIGSGLTTYQNATTVRSVIGVSPNAIASTASGTNITGQIFISPPVSAGVTISGTITFNAWAKEDSTSCNCTVGYQVLKYTGGAESTSLTDSSFGTEVTTTILAKNWTATPTSVTLAAGDRLVLKLKNHNATSTTMATGHTMTVDYGGVTNAADGDSYVQFTETFSFTAEPEIIQINQNATGSGSTLGTTFSGTNTTGNLIADICDWDSQSITASVSDSVPNTYTPVDGPTNWNGTTSRAETFYAANITGGSKLSPTCTLSSTAANLQQTVIEIAGLDTSSPLDTHAIAIGNGTAVSSGSSMTTAANDVLIGLAVSAVSVTYTAGTNYVVLPTSGQNPAAEGRYVTSTGSYDAPATFTTGQWIGAMLALKSATQPAGGSTLPSGMLLGVGD